MAADYPPRESSASIRAKGLGPVAAALLTVAAVGLTSALGAWQLSRAHQKQALQAQRDARRLEPPLEAAALARTAADAPAQYERRVVLSGRWLPEFTVLLDNRPMDGRVGFEVVTPLQVTGAQTVVVQRGWVARDPVEPGRVPPFLTPTGEVTIHGRISPPPSRWLQLGPDAPGRIRQNLDLAGMQHDAGAAQRPLLVVEDASDASVVDGLSRHWPAPAVSVDRNYGYAAQWFAMSAAAIALYLWLQFIRPRRGRTS
jgi:surfeit locus 1 family protein